MLDPRQTLEHWDKERENSVLQDAVSLMFILSMKYLSNLSRLHGLWEGGCGWQCTIN
jgi:hypothetical protein